MTEELAMTEEQAIEACARAIARRSGHEHIWNSNDTLLEKAKDMVVALEALGLLKLLTH